MFISLIRRYSHLLQCGGRGIFGCSRGCLSAVGISSSGLPSRHPLGGQFEFGPGLDAVGAAGAVGIYTVVVSGVVVVSGLVSSSGRPSMQPHGGQPGCDVAGGFQSTGGKACGAVVLLTVVEDHSVVVSGEVQTDVVVSHMHGGHVDTAE